MEIYILFSESQTDDPAAQKNRSGSGIARRLFQKFFLFRDLKNKRGRFKLSPGPAIGKNTKTAKKEKGAKAV